MKNIPLFIFVSLISEMDCISLLDEMLNVLVVSNYDDTMVTVALIWQNAVYINKFSQN